jgi:hypothetical protein
MHIDRLIVHQVRRLQRQVDGRRTRRRKPQEVAAATRRRPLHGFACVRLTSAPSNNTRGNRVAGNESATALTVRRTRLRLTLNSTRSSFARVYDEIVCNATVACSSARATASPQRAIHGTDRRVDLRELAPNENLFVCLSNSPLCLPFV